ncbi:MAG TPA: ATP-binding protein [Oceanospirillales bacterium]|nr:ATP-binding protein [Oceanospirillales bacterium]
MIIRNISNELLCVAKEYPVVTILGPRQAGKTTLAKQVFGEHTYCNLEHPEIRRLAEDDPNAFFKRFRGNLIIDEIQRVPELLYYIQVMVDEHEVKGQFILTGSHQLSLHESISQSLAGRTAILKLLPLSIQELQTVACKYDHFDYMLHGFLPKIYKDKLNPSRYYSNYYETYVQRDVRALIKLKDLSSFEKFIKLLAGRVGQVINLSSLSNDVGVSSQTLKQWLSVLEASFIVVKLEPYYENFGKRVIKSAKIYFTDNGLLSYLLGIENTTQLQRDPLIGQMFENLVVIECMKNRYNQGKNPNLYYFRTDKGQEVDLLYKNGRQLILIEIKSAMTFNKKFTKGIKYFQKITQSTSKAYIVYAGDLEYKAEDYSVINYLNVKQIFI